MAKFISTGTASAWPFLVQARSYRGTAYFFQDTSNAISDGYGAVNINANDNGDALYIKKGGIRLEQSSDTDTDDIRMRLTTGTTTQTNFTVGIDHSARTLALVTGTDPAGTGGVLVDNDGKVDDYLYVTSLKFGVEKKLDADSPPSLPSAK